MDAAQRSGPHQAPDDPGRHESPEEREDRNLMELLQELRVAAIGVQVLFGFLLSLPFTQRFRILDEDQRDLYVVSLLMAAAATVLLAGPVAYHRLVFRQHQKARLVRVAGLLALGGLAAVAVAVTAAVALVASVVLHGTAAVGVVVLTVGFVAVFWVVIPVHAARMGRSAAVLAAQGPYAG